MQGRMKNKPGPTTPPRFTLREVQVDVYFVSKDYSNFSSSPSEAKYDRPLVLLDSLQAEPDGDGEGDRNQDHRPHLDKTRQLQLILSMMLIITFNTPSQVLESSSDFSICLISVDMVLNFRCLTRFGSY